MISVIVPVYNVAKFLNKSVESIVNQDYDNIEILLIDDGSTDGSGVLCDNWAQRDHRIKVIHKRNGGLSDARNVGIENATGKYLTFIDSDDFIESNYLSTLFDIITNYNCDVSVCQFFYVDINDNPIETRTTKTEIQVFETTVSCMKSYMCSGLIGATAWGKLYKSTLFLENNIRYPYGKLHEDLFTTYKIIDNCHRIVVTSQKLYAYRQLTSSIIHTFSLKRLNDSIEALDYQNRFIDGKYPQLSHQSRSNYLSVLNAFIYNLPKKSDTSLIPKEILKLYRKYGWEFILTNHSIKSKFFVFCCMLAPIAFIKMIKSFR